MEHKRPFISGQIAADIPGHSSTAFFGRASRWNFEQLDARFQKSDAPRFVKFAERLLEGFLLTPKPVEWRRRTVVVKRQFPPPLSSASTI